MTTFVLQIPSTPLSSPPLSMPAKVAIVTGSAQGIGKAIALRLAKDGFNVVVSDLPSKDKATEEVAQTAASEFKVGAKAKSCDVSQEEQVKKLVEFAVSEFGRLDVVSSRCFPYIPR